MCKPRSSAQSLPPGPGVDDREFRRISLLATLRTLVLAQRIQATRNAILALSSEVDRFEQAILNNDSLTDELRHFFMEILHAQREGIATRRAALEEQEAAFNEIGHRG